MSHTHSNELAHWGIKGMRWGVRRFQNADGSLTPAGRKRYKYVENEGDGKSDKGAVRKVKVRWADKDGKMSRKVEDAEIQETLEQTRARLLNSTNAKEIYEGRKYLTTNELNERINRIDTEARLASKIVEEPTKSGMQRVDEILKVARKVDEVYKFTSESAIGKQMSKKLFGDSKIDETTTKYLKKELSKMNDDELKKALTRMASEKKYNELKKELDEAKSPSRTPTKNLIGDLSDLTDAQVKELYTRLDYEEKVVSKLSNRK